MAVGVGTSTAQTPLNTNFAGLKRFVANYVQGADQPSILGVAGDAITAGIDILNTKLWNWSIKTQTITTVSSDADYSLNADFKKPRKLFRNDTSGNRTGWLNFKEPKAFMDQHPAAISDSVPGVYTVINPTANPVLLLNFPPAADWVTSYPTLTLYYYSRVQHFGGNSQTMSDIGAPPEVWTFLGWYGRWDLAATRSDSRSVERAFSMWNRMLRDLKADDGDVQTDWELP